MLLYLKMGFKLPSTRSHCCRLYFDLQDSRCDHEQRFFHRSLLEEIKMYYKRLRSNLPTGFGENLSMVFSTRIRLFIFSPEERLIEQLIVDGVNGMLTCNQAQC